MWILEFMGKSNIFNFFETLLNVRILNPYFRYSPLKGYDPVENQRRMERFAIDHQGYAAPYAETQLTFEEFNEMFAYNLKTYDKLRKDLECEKAFPHVYEKISKLGRS